MSDISKYFYYMQIVQKIGGILSCAGSGYIFQDVLRDPDKRTKSIYHRIMLGLSVTDILSSFFFWFLGSWAMPKGSWIWTAGNIITCDIAAAIGGIGYVGSSLYNCSLVTFYLLQLKYNWSDRKMKSIEKWLHIVPWSLALTRCISSLATKMYGPYFGFCTISRPYPYGCDKPKSGIECIRGMHNLDIYWIISNSTSMLATIYVAVTMFVVYTTVRDIERKAEKYCFLAKFRAHSRKKTMKRSRRVMIQGLLYSVVMVVLYLPLCINFIIHMIGKDRNLVIWLLSINIIPLQGVLNLFIYLVPVFRKMLKTYRQRKGTEKEKAKINMIAEKTSPTGASSEDQKIESTSDKGEEENNLEISVQHTFHPEPSMEKGNREDHDHLVFIDDDDSVSVSSGDDYY